MKICIFITLLTIYFSSFCIDFNSTSIEDPTYEFFDDFELVALSRLSNRSLDDPEIDLELGRIYEQEFKKRIPSAQTAEYRFRELAFGQDFVLAYRNLGVIGALDYTKLEGAIRHYSAAAQRGYVEAHFSLGRLYENKALLEHDCCGGQERKAQYLALAKKHYHQAAEQNHAQAQNNLALLYQEEGRDEEALLYYRLAADQGLEQAQRAVAALEGDVEEQLAMGAYYHKKRGEYTRASLYYNLASKAGSIYAQNRLELIRIDMMLMYEHWIEAFLVTEDYEKAEHYQALQDSLGGVQDAEYYLPILSTLDDGREAVSYVSYIMLLGGPKLLPLLLPALKPKVSPEFFATLEKHLESKV